MYTHPVRAAKVVQVIETVEAWGDGTPADPVRTVKSYWSLDGELLFRKDHFLASMDSASSNISSESM